MVQESIQEKEETLFQKVQKMTTSEKIRLALRGDKEVRSLLIRDGERTVQLAVVNNPRITDSEIISIANSRNIHEEVLRRVSTGREWLKLYPVRLALVQNPKTVATVSLKLLATLTVKDLRMIARSKSVPSMIAQVALRMLNARG